jgi:hypothetical protein
MNLPAWIQRHPVFAALIGAITIFLTYIVPAWQSISNEPIIPAIGKWLSGAGTNPDFTTWFLGWAFWLFQFVGGPIALIFLFLIWRQTKNARRESVVEEVTPIPHALESPLQIEFEWNFFDEVQEGQGLDYGRRKTFYVYIFNSALKDASAVNVNVTKIAAIDTPNIIEKVHSALDQRRYPLRFKNTGAYEKNISPRGKERVDVVSYSNAITDENIRLESGSDGHEIHHPYNAYRLDIEVTASELPPRTEFFDIVVDPQGEFRMVKLKKG